MMHTHAADAGGNKEGPWKLLDGGGAGSFHCVQEWITFEYGCFGVNDTPENCEGNGRVPARAAVQGV